MLPCTGLSVRLLALMVNCLGTLRTEIPIVPEIDHFGTSDTTMTYELGHGGLSFSGYFFAAPSSFLPSVFLSTWNDVTVKPLSYPYAP